ncbi:MAG: anthranilate phosphoribosyltransferase [Alphaproteobacteria bacterium]|nr:anthranilate phosphoribosyltransferase [Alphaproteobacteria bacterium]
MSEHPPSPRSLKPLLAKVADGKALSEAEAAAAFDIIMSGEATAAQIGGFLMGLRVRGETVEEIAGAVTVMREKMTRITAPPGAIDVVGTGGDAQGTYNISTAAALIVAGAGVPVAKHGNRAVSSKSGAADVLKALGVNLDCDLALVERALKEAGIAFLMAPRHHGAMRHVGPARGELGVRTIFNILGPLSNPAGVKRQMTGCFSRTWIEPMAAVLGRLGCERAWVVHGSDGLDELTTTGSSFVAEWKDGGVHAFEVSPEDVGLARVNPALLKGGDAEVNARAIREILDGKSNPFREIAEFNAGAALLVAGKAKNLADGVKLAAQSVNQGRAKAALYALVRITNSDAAQ